MGATELPHVDIVFEGQWSQIDKVQDSQGYHSRSSVIQCSSEYLWPQVGVCGMDSK